MNILKRWKEKKAKEEAERKQRNEEYRDGLNQKIIDDENVMFSKQCPMTGNKCVETCVCFERGRIKNTYYYMRDSGRVNFPSVAYSRCKLWKERD